MVTKMEISTAESETASTLQHHLAAVAGGNLDDILSDYGDQSALITPDQTYHGLGELRAFFVGMMEKLPTDWMSKVTVIRQEISTEVAYLFWKAPPFFPLATDTFVIRNGKILTQTFALLA